MMCLDFRESVPVPSNDIERGAGWPSGWGGAAGRHPGQRGRLVLLPYRAATPMSARCSSDPRHASALRSGQSTQQIALAGRQCWCTAVLEASSSRPRDGRLHTVLCTELRLRAYGALSGHQVCTGCSAAHCHRPLDGPRTAPRGTNPTLLPPHPCISNVLGTEKRGVTYGFRH